MCWPLYLEKFFFWKNFLRGILCLRWKHLLLKKDLHLAAVLPFWDCFKQNSGFEVPWNTLVVWMRLPIHDSRLGYLSVQFSSVPPSCPTTWDPLDGSTPSLLVHHQLLEFTQTHITFGSPLMQGWSPLEPQLILASVFYLIAHFVQAADFGFNSLYTGRSSKTKFKIFKIGKRPQDKRVSVLSNFSGFLSSLQFWPSNSW